MQKIIFIKGYNYC